MPPVPSLLACLPFPLLPSSYLFYFRCLPAGPLAVPRPAHLLLFWLVAFFLRASSSFPVDSLYLFLNYTCDCMDHGL